MGYSTIQQVSDALANAMIQGHAGNGITTPVPLINRGNLPTNTINDALINDFISRADERIDSIFSSIYDVPFNRVVVSEHKLLSDAVLGATVLSVEDTSRITTDSYVMIVSSSTRYVLSIASITSATTLTLSTGLPDAYTTANYSRIQRQDYPPPIPLISRYIAAALMYDKYFAAQQAPNVSDYGKELRKLAVAYFNDVLSGRTTLHGQHRIGLRFAAATLLNEHNLSIADARVTTEGA